MKYTVCFLFTPDGKQVLMTRKKKTTYKGRLNGVGGKIKPNETPVRGAQREIMEETGVDLKISDLHWLATTMLPEDCGIEPGDTPQTCELHFYGALINPDDVNFNTGEDLNWVLTDTVMHARPQDERFAGDGDTPYIVNAAVRHFGFDIKAIGMYYDVLIGAEGDDYVYAENVHSTQLDEIRTKLTPTLRPEAYIKVIPHR